MPFEPLTVDRIEARAVLLPLKRPVVSKIGLFREWPLILIDLFTNQGLVGRSYLEPYLKSSVGAIIGMLMTLAETRRGAPLVPLDDFAKGRSAFSPVGLQGVALIAVSGLDMAAWDALAKAAGMPLAVLLGGSIAPVPAYNSNGLWLNPPDSLGEEAQALVAEGGFTALKLRLGRPRLADDLRAIRAVRGALGDDITLMVDFNQGLSYGDAVRRCHELDDQGLYWFEEPIAYDNLAGYAELARALKTPIQLGENFYGPRALLDACRAGVGDYVMLDLMRIGGVSGWLRAAAIAGAAGIEMSSHLYPEFSAHLLRASESAHWLEWQDWADAILAEPMKPAGGKLAIANRPGAGIEWNEAAIRRYRVDG